MKIIKHEYSLGEIPPSVTNKVFEIRVEPQPCLLREVHSQGDPSTNYSFRIYDRERMWKVDKIFSKSNANLESHDPLSLPLNIFDIEKRRVWVEIDNNDSTNTCKFILKLVIEVENGQ